MKERPPSTTGRSAQHHLDCVSPPQASSHSLKGGVVGGGRYWACGRCPTSISRTLLRIQAHFTLGVLSHASRLYKKGPARTLTANETSTCPEVDVLATLVKGSFREATASSQSRERFGLGFCVIHNCVIRHADQTSSRTLRLLFPGALGKTHWQILSGMYNITSCSLAGGPWAWGSKGHQGQSSEEEIASLFHLKGPWHVG